MRAAIFAGILAVATITLVVSYRCSHDRLAIENRQLRESLRSRHNVLRAVTREMDRLEQELAELRSGPGDTGAASQPSAPHAGDKGAYHRGESRKPGDADR